MVLDECLAWPSPSRRRRARRWSSRCAGRGARGRACWRSAQARPSPGPDGQTLAPVPLVTPAQAQFGIVQGGTYPSLRAASAGRHDRHRVRGLRDRRPERRRARPDVMYDIVEHDRAAAARRSAALSDGRRHAGGPGRGRRARRRHVRLRAARRATPATASCSRATGKLNIKNAQYAEDERPVDDAVQVLHLPHLFARVSCGISMSPER